jgi:nucleoside-diphosphate-sugar epimerase
MGDGTLYLVTGAAGFVGRYMVEMLRERGHAVRASDLPAEPPRDYPDGVEYVQADLTRPESLAGACEGVGIIFHPASVFDFSTPREVMERVNVGGTENLCLAAAGAGVERLVQWGTMMVFGEKQRRSEPITEDTPHASASIYASSKSRQEEVALRFHGEGRLAVTVVRPAIIYGPRSVYGLADILIKARHLPRIPVVPAMKARICLVHVRDVVGAAYHLAHLEEAAGECYNLVDDFSHLTIRDLLTLAAVVLEKPALTLPLPNALVRWSLQKLADFTSAHEWMRVEGRPIMEQDFLHLLRMDGYASNAKLTSTGYRLGYPDWRIGLLETSRWYRERGMW